MATYYVDGKYVKDSEAALPLSDMAILRGYAVFDFLRTYNGRPFHLEEHLLRLQNSAALLQINFPWNLQDINKIVDELLQKNGFSETNLRFIVTGGDSSDSITPENKPRLIVMASSLKSYPAEWYRNGVKVITTQLTRFRPDSKSTNYIKAILALKNASADGAIDSIYVNENNEMLEGTTTNIFAVKGDTIITPDDGVLPGITREVVINLASRDFKVEKAPLSRDELPLISEAFLTSSNKEVLPIIQIDDQKISPGPGRVTRRVMDLFREYTTSW
ncbi:MAG: aminotransferase class IV [Desulfocapsaceae bacterium]|nr:aminotransferase class IV [Desulfocapsaceae bacterium]